MSVKDKEDKLVFNRGHHGKLTEEHYSPGKAVAYFSGKEMTDGVCEAKQWLEAIIEDKEPLVKPEQAFVVTQILDTIYKAAAEGHEIAL